MYFCNVYVFVYRTFFVYRVSCFEENYLIPIRRMINDYRNCGTFTLKHLELRTHRTKNTLIPFPT